MYATRSPARTNSESLCTTRTSTCTNWHFVLVLYQTKPVLNVLRLNSLFCFLFFCFLFFLFPHSNNSRDQRIEMEKRRKVTY